MYVYALAYKIGKAGENEGKEDSAHVDVYYFVSMLSMHVIVDQS